MVRQSPHHLKIKSSSPAIATGTGAGEGEKEEKILKRSFGKLNNVVIFKSNVIKNLELFNQLGLN